MAETIMPSFSEQDSLNALNSKLATDDFGTVTVAQLETKLQTAFASTTLGTPYYFTAVISESSGVFVPTQYTGQIVKIHSEQRYYIEMYQAYGFAKIVGKYQSSFEWNSYALNSNLTTKYPSMGITGMMAIKYGNVLMLSNNNTSQQTASANTTLWTLPEGFRPVAKQDFVDSYSKKRIEIGTDGKITCAESLSGAYLRWCIMYIFQ